MKSILETCDPRPDISEGSFNLVIFTASRIMVIDFSLGDEAGLDTIYTNEGQLFTEATFPSSRMKLVSEEVFGRIKGRKYPAIHRERAFGGGKTHALIASTPVAYRGSELAAVTEDLIETSLLPVFGDIKVLEIPGDTPPVHQTSGQQLTPYTMWGEVAFQVGGEERYQQRKFDLPDAES